MERSVVDLSGLGPLAARFHVYLLACRELHQRLPALEIATTGARLDESNAIGLFNEALGDFLRRCTEIDPLLSARDFENKLAGKFSSERRDSPSVVELIVELGEAVIQATGARQPEEELQAIHGPAREVARRFFADSPHEETQMRTERHCRLLVEIRNTASSSRAPMYHTAHELGDHKPENAGAIHIPFNDTKNFGSYLDYPFLFLHEYTAHAIAIDHGSENGIFNDGWMVVAADAFFVQEQSKAPGSYPFGPEQTQAFTDRLRGTIQGSCARAITYGQPLRWWLDKLDNGRFDRITYDLAAFRPHASEPVTWPRAFVSRLLVSYRTDPGALERHIRGTVTTQDLMERLPRLTS
jgi:hypothetical protein